MELDPDELAQLDAAVIDALDRVDYSALNVLGNGELSVVLGWPADAPRVVCKPLAPCSHQQLEDLRGLIADYMAELRRRGVGVVDTNVV